MKYKALMLSFFSIIILLIFFIATLPTILSINPGKKIVSWIIRKKGYKNFSVGSFSFHWLGPQKIKRLTIKIENTDIYADILETDLPFWNLIKINKRSIFKDKISTSLKNGSIKITHPNDHFSILTNIEGSLIPSGNSNSHDISISGQSSINKKIGYFSIFATIGENEKIGNIKLQNFPIKTIDELVLYYLPERKGIVSKIIGERADFFSSFKITNSKGLIDIDLFSTNAKSKFSAIYTDHSITLSSPLNASINLTEDLSKYLLKEINPLLIHTAKGQNPLLINIPSEGFYLPINPFKISELKIKKAMIDLGKIRTKNGTNISTIIGIMKNHSLKNVDEMNVWCTPMYVNISEGILHTSRIDLLLADEIHICSWGSIDLLKQKVKMTLGLTTQALKKSFGIKNLPPNYILQIAMKGTPAKLKINKKEAAAKIASLLAIDKLNKKSSLGQIVKTLKTIGEDQSKVPPPYHPLPWEE